VLVDLVRRKLGIEMRFQQKEQVLIVRRHIQQWEITTITKTQVHSI
jgi:hypothetical protein